MFKDTEQGQTQSEQSTPSAEPVAWQYRVKGDADEWLDWRTVGYQQHCPESATFQTRALYLTPPSLAAAESRLAEARKVIEEATSVLDRCVPFVSLHGSLREAVFKALAAIEKWEEGKC